MTAVDGAGTRVSTVELFFDLVFVFTITQLTTLLAREPDLLGLARVALIFGNLWWMYGGYAWLTNAVPPRSTELRALLLLGMASFFVIALATPQAFGAAGVAFGAAYMAVTAVHTLMFSRSSEQSVVRSIVRLGPANLVTACVLLAAGFSGGALQWALWTAAFALHWVTPIFTAVEGFRIRAGHFVERHGLIVLIALGESVVAVGIGVRAVDISAGLAATALLGLALAAALWWLYFDGDDQRAERALETATAQRTPWLALYGFGYAFLPIVTGILVFAAGLKRATGHFGEAAPAATAWFVAGGVAAYLLGLAWFRALLRIGTARVRMLTALLALATVPLGMHASTEAQLGVLVALVAGSVVVEKGYWPMRPSMRSRKRSA